MEAIPREIIQEILEYASYKVLRAFAFTCKKWAKFCKAVLHRRADELSKWRGEDDHIFQCLPNGLENGLEIHYISESTMYINTMGHRYATVYFSKMYERNPKIKIEYEDWTCIAEIWGKRVQALSYKCEGTKIRYDIQCEVPKIPSDLKKWRKFINFIKSGHKTFPHEKNIFIEIEIDDFSICISSHDIQHGGNIISPQTAKELLFPYGPHSEVYNIIDIRARPQI